MKKVFFIITACFLSLTVFLPSCGDDIEDPVLIVTPSDLDFNAAPGQQIEFSLRAKAGEKDLRNIIINQKPNGGITENLLDTAVSDPNVEFNFVYTVPFTQANSVILTFKVYDTDGNTSGALRRIYISGSAPLSETTGHFLYSRYAEDALNAFNIENLEPLSLATSPDSSNVDLVNLDSSDDDNMSRSITSYSGIKFVRNNSFNYPEATQQSAENSFTSSTGVPLVSNLQVDDILITKYDTLNNKFAIIRITNIVDDAGSDGDRFEFNLKK